MAFDQATRNRLARFVGDGRSLLTEEFTRQLQHEYGIDPASGEVANLDRLSHLDDTRRETAIILRDTLTHYMAGQAKQTVRVRQDMIDRIIREQAFTVLNRLCALRMMEARGLLLESVVKGYQSRGFQLYNRLAGSALGETGDAYRSYLSSLFDEFAVDLPVLFDRFSPQGRLFPRPTTLLQLLDEINHPDIDPLWAEDETIGWIYQYFNSVDERRQMRAASQAPRNSRELAVRNQFFTPRYVVEFLTDNTLGRIWYEMTQGETALAESCRYLVRRPHEIFLAKGEAAPEQPENEADLSQEELLQQPVYIPYRPLKDPRDIKMLDPACGSMHFGLYAFDLYEQIYAEAWHLETNRGAHAFTRPEELEALHQTYADEAAFRRDVPRLIIEHNIHGIDIDPRAVQIAGLSLWLRAQKSWQIQGVKPQDRPIVTRSNVVTAEPMPGDAELLNEFVERYLSDTAENRLLGQLVKRVFEAMKLAGEAGSLLKIEQEIAADIVEAKEKWYAKPQPKQIGLFTEAVSHPKQDALSFDVSGITDAMFWEQVEEKIYIALQLYSATTENNDGFRRRLFVEDTERGFAFIDLCRKHYSVILMNPPFGESAKSTKSYIDKQYPLSKHDVAIALVERWLSTLENVRLGAITTRTPLYNSSSCEWRRQYLLHNKSITTCLDLGNGVLDAMVETASYILEPNKATNNTIFIQLTTTHPEEKGDVALTTISTLHQNIQKSSLVHVRNLDELFVLPNSPLSYWLPASISKCFQKHSALKDSDAEAWVGLQTSKDERFLRLWWEIDPSETGWKPFAKGGEASPYFADIHLVVKWLGNGHEMKAYHDHLNYIGKSTPGNGPRRDFPFYFVPGLTWVYRTDRFHVQPLPEGCITSTRGPGIYSEKRIPFLLAYLNSSIADVMVKVLLGKHTQPQFDIDDVNAIPIPKNNDSTLEQLGYEAWQIRNNLICDIEEFRGYRGGFLYSRELNKSLNSQYKSSLLNRKEAINKLQKIQKQIDALSTELLNIPNQAFSNLENIIFEWNDFGITAENKLGFIHRCISSCIGIIFGRWDIDCWIHTKQSSNNPLSPFPICPPAQLKNSDGLPVGKNEFPNNYPLEISKAGILVNDVSHTENIKKKLHDVLQTIWQNNAEIIEQEVCEVFDVTSLTHYFDNPNKFFANHLKQYSKSRRYAPIYWPLSTQSSNYTIWLYYHRIDEQILYTAINNFVDPKLKDVSQQVNALRQKTSRSKTQEDDLTQLSDLEAELKEFRTELLRIASFWRPNLNDGVQITAAPLWQLFRHRQWQNRLKDTWEKLETGEYDWAHLAMSIWPERVVPKCVSDRSLAIAHDLENLFWVEDDGNWRLLQAPDQEIAEQKKRRQIPTHDRLRQHLEALAAGSGRGIPAYQVWQHLSEGNWDDTAVALALWPERVGEKCWDNPLMAAHLGLKSPPKRTKANRNRFLKRILEESTPELAQAVAAAFQDEEDAFDVVWQAMVKGDKDEQSLALALWPARVIDKCAANVEIAIQHDLHRYFWYQPSDGIWRRRKPQSLEIKDEITRRQAHK